MHLSSTTHYGAAKRLLRYLVGTLSISLLIQRYSSLSLHAYSNADYAANIDDRTSTDEYVDFLSPNPVSWSSKSSVLLLVLPLRWSIDRSVAVTASKLYWVNRLPYELGI